MWTRDRHAAARCGGHRCAQASVSGEAEAGYAMVDALVGLTIFASVLVLSLAAGATAAKLAGRASAVERARGELVRRLEAAPTEPGERSGETADFAWTVTVERFDSSVAKDLCRVRVELTPKTGSPLQLSTLKPCRGDG